MNKKTLSSIIFLMAGILTAQNELTSDQLYKDQTPLEIKLGYSNKDLNKDTNDSTFIITSMAYTNEGKWAEIEVNLRARGNFRRNECYFPPVKMKIKKNQ